MKDYNHKDHVHGLHKMEAKHMRKRDGSFYHNVGSHNLMKGGHSIEHTEMKMAGHSSKY